VLAGEGAFPAVGAAAYADRWAAEDTSLWLAGDQK